MAIRPIIFVGLGSAGGKIVSRLKEQMNQKADDLTRRFCRYVNIRSEVAPEEGTDGNITSISLASPGLESDDIIKQMWYPGPGNTSQKSAENFRKWWRTDKKAPEKPWYPGFDLSLDTGVGGNPSIGRALLHYKLNGNSVGDLPEQFYRFQADFRTTFEELPIEARMDVRVEQINCFLFGSLAGGTCTGILYDIALIIKAQLGFGTNIFGVFLMGDACSAGLERRELSPILVRLQHRNTQHTIAEMAFLSSLTGWNIAKREWPRVIGGIDLTDNPWIFDENPFSSISLMGAENDDGYAFNNFEAYLQFLAVYYSNFIASGQLETMLCRDIDARPTVTAAFPSRPCYFTRIGYLCLQNPTKKIEALIRSRIAEELRLRFMTPDSAKCKVLLDKYTNKLMSIFDWTKQCIGKKVVEPVFPSDDLLPDNPEDYEQIWRTILAEIYHAYAPFWDEASEENREILAQFREKWNPLLDELLDSMLGQNDDPLSLAEVKLLLSALRERSSVEYDACLAIQTEKSSLFRKLHNEFEETLQKTVAAFPKGLLAWFKRKTSTANQEMGEIAGKYLVVSQERARATIQKIIWKQIIDDLKRHICVRELISHYATGPAYRHFMVEEARLFAEDSESKYIDQEILSRRDDILEYYVNPLLEANDYALLNYVIATILRKWAVSNECKIGVAGIWKTLIGLFDKELPHSSDEVYKDNQNISSLLKQSKEEFQILFDEAFHEVFDEAVSNLSIWDAIARYINGKERGNYSKGDTLQKMFKIYLGHAKCFPRMRLPIVADRFEYVNSSLTVICNEEDALHCLRLLDLPDFFNVERLIQRTLHCELFPRVESSNARDKILFMLCVQHELPYFYKGFEDVMEVLIPQLSKEEDENEGWFDYRFPGWIKTWWNTENEKEKPYYLSAIVGHLTKDGE